jgi:hypothetical protein
VLSKPITPKSMNVLGHGLALPLNRQSLDLATGPLINFGGASAAYSLRDLNGRNPRVVRVRRASDNHERDFYKDDINSGELTNWVNSQIVPPLDIGVETSEGRIPVPEGGTSIGIPAAAYSLRNLSTTYTGNVVDVRRSSGGTESFTAAEVADGTLTDWVLAPVSSFIGNKMYFDRVNDYINLDSFISYTGDFTLTFSFIPDTLDGTIQPVVGNGNIDYIGVAQINGSDRIYVSTLAGSTQFIVLDSNFTEKAVNDVIISRSGSTITFTVNGDVQSTTLTYSTTIPISRIGARGIGVALLKGIITELDFGNGTTFDGTIADGNTIGTVNGSPELFTGQGFDGFVTQWYDQSGNDNHATQGTAASQPKIVDGGSLVTGGLDFDGVDDYLITTQAGQLPQPVSLFQVFSSDILVPSDYQIDAMSNIAMLSGGDGSIYYFAGSLLDSNINFPTSGDTLHSVVFNGSSSTVFADGSSVATGNTGNGAFRKTFGIGARKAGTQPSNISYKELIIYDSDQSANRTAIEANIGETYGITGIPAYDNTVDGFVETWYDQSGNGNDATQSVAASQPKIVAGGTLATKLGQPSINFTTDSAVLLSDSFSITETESAVFAIWQPAKDSATTVQARHRTLFGNESSEIYIGTPNSDSQMSFKRFGAVKTFTLGLASLNTPNLHAFVGTTAGVDYYFNGSSIYSDTATGTNSIRNHLRIGSKQNLATHDTEGYISELIIYDSDQSANRSGIETNINNHYNIY